MTEEQMLANRKVSDTIDSIKEYLIFESVFNRHSHNSYLSLMHYIEDMSENVSQISTNMAISVLEISKQILKIINNHEVSKAIQKLVENAADNHFNVVFRWIRDNKLSMENSINNFLKKNPQQVSECIDELCKIEWMKKNRIYNSDYEIIENMIKIRPDLASNVIEYIKQTEEELSKTRSTREFGDAFTILEWAKDGVINNMKKIPYEQLPEEWRQHFDNEKIQREIEKKRRLEEEAKSAERREKLRLEMQAREEKIRLEEEVLKAKEAERLKQEALIRINDGKIEDKIIKCLMSSYATYVLSGDTSKPFYATKNDLKEAINMLDDLVKISPIMIENVLFDKIDFKSFSNVDENILDAISSKVSKIENNQDIMQKINEAKIGLQQKHAQRQKDGKGNGNHGPIYE